MCKKCHSSLLCSRSRMPFSLPLTFLSVFSVLMSSNLTPVVNITLLSQDYQSPAEDCKKQVLASACAAQWNVNAFDCEVESAQ